MPTKRKGSAAKPPAKGEAAAGAAAPASAPAAPQLSKHQAFTIERLHRSALATAPYNPRVITDEAKAKLQRNLSKVGLLEPLIWNRTTGTLLGGHQRLACLDALEGTADYLLDVSVVELSEVQEREQNIALNNANLQGSYDVDTLAELLKTPDLELEATGFDFNDIQVSFEDPELATLFAPNEPTKAALSEVEKQQKASKSKERMQRVRDKDAPEYSSQQDTETVLVATFATREQREAAVVLLGYSENERYIDGKRLVELLTRLRAEAEAGRSSKKVTASRRGASKGGAK